MKRYQIHIDIMSNIDEKRWEQWLTKAIEKTHSSINHISVNERSPGRVSVNGPKVEAYLRGLSGRAREKVTVEQIMIGSSLPETAVVKQMRRLVMEGRAQRIRTADRKLVYRLLDGVDSEGTS